MELPFSLVFSQAVLRRPPGQRQRVPATPDETPRQTPGLTAKLVAGLLVLTLLGAAAATALAESAQRGRPAHRQEQGQDVTASTRKGRKTKTITRTFQSGDANGTEIAIPAIGSPDDLGLADPYPSRIEVTGFKRAKVADVNLTLIGLSHDFVPDIDVLLVAPNGRNAVVMGDVGNEFVAEAVRSLSITLDDEAAAPLPTDTALTSGAFQPLDADTDEDDIILFPAPAPTVSGDVALATFDGSDPNGAWQLFLLDDTHEDTGQLAEGWSLEITAKSKVKAKGKPKHRGGRRH